MGALEDHAGLIRYARCIRWYALADNRAAYQAIAALADELASSRDDAALGALMRQLPENWRVGWEAAPPYGIPPEKPCWFVESHTGEILAESLEIEVALHEALESPSIRDNDAAPKMGATAPGKGTDDG